MIGKGLCCSCICGSMDRGCGDCGGDSSDNRSTAFGIGGSRGKSWGGCGGSRGAGCCGSLVVVGSGGRSLRGKGDSGTTKTTTALAFTLFSSHGTLRHLDTLGIWLNRRNRVLCR